MLVAARSVFAAIGLVSTCSAYAAPSSAKRFRFRIDQCSVTALRFVQQDSDRPVSADGRVRGNAFLVEHGGLSVLIAPVPMSAADRQSLWAGRSAPQAIVLTSLEPLQTSALVEDGRAVFPQSSIYVDRALVDDARDLTDAQVSARKILATYRAIGRLHLIDPDTDVLPGVKIFASRYRPFSETRIRVGCGPTSLIVLPAREVAFGSNGVDHDRRDERLPPLLASDAYLLALTDGAFPGIGRIYLAHDGYHWGSIAARSLGGTGRRRGEVFVEPGDDSSHHLKEAPHQDKGTPKTP